MSASDYAAAYLAGENKSNSTATTTNTNANTANYHKFFPDSTTTTTTTSVTVPTASQPASSWQPSSVYGHNTAYPYQQQQQQQQQPYSATTYPYQHQQQPQSQQYQQPPSQPHNYYSQPPPSSYPPPYQQQQQPSSNYGQHYSHPPQPNSSIGGSGAWNPSSYPQPPPPPQASYPHYSHQSLPSHQPYQTYGTPSQYPPTTAPPSGPQYNPATGNFMPNYQTNTPLTSSFVPATSSESTYANLPPPPPPPSSSMVATTRGAVHSSTADSSSALSSASIAAATSTTASSSSSTPISFTIASTTLSAKRTRWGTATKDPNNSAIFKQDLTQSTPVSQTAVTTHTTHTAQAPQQSYGVQPSSTGYNYSTTTQPNPSPSSHPYSTTATTTTTNPFPPQTSLGPAPASTSTPFTPSTAMLSYIERSLTDPTCPFYMKSAVEQFLAAKYDQISKTPSLANSIDWSKEPLAYRQMSELRGPSKSPPINTGGAMPPSKPASYYSSATSNNNSTFGRPSPYVATGSNNTPLGVRSSKPTSDQTESKEFDSSDMNDENTDYISLKGGPKSKKRNWEESPFDDSNTDASGKKAKKKKGSKGHSTTTFNAHDLAKVADRASRFAEYNAAVAQSSDTFKNPIQRHLFTAERGDEDLEMDWANLHIRGTCEVLEKKYLRLTQAPDPSVVRPERVLKRALDMILHKWRSDPTGTSERDHVHDYLYTCDQLKSIRQDLTVQHLKHSPLTIEVYEQHGRIALEVGDFSEYNQCQTQLKNLYIDNPTRCQNQEEFLMYRILYNLITNNQSALTEMLREIQKSRIEEENRSVTPIAYEPLLTPTSATIPTSPISLAFKVALAGLQNDSFNFFRCYTSLPFSGTTILKSFAAHFRFESLQRLIRGFKPGKVELAFFVRVLGFESEIEAEGYLVPRGIILTQEKLVDTKASELHELEDDETDTAINANGVTHAMI